MVILEFSMFPLDKGESVSEYVARILEIVDQSGLNYQTHAMGTLIEGEIDEVLEIVRKCHGAMEVDCHRIECSIKLDYRKGRTDGIRSKVASAEAKLGRTVNK